MKEESRVKRTYKTPKAIHVDFHYDVQVKAASSDLGVYGDPQQIGRCQQNNEYTCVYFWNADGPLCQSDPFSLGRS